MDTISGFILQLMHLSVAMRLLIGILLMFIGGAWLIFAAYSEDAWWGRWLIVFPGLSLFFCVDHPKKGLPPFIIQFIGVAIFVSAFLSFFPGGYH